MERELVRHSSKMAKDGFSFVPNGIEKLELSGSEFKLYLLLLRSIEKNDRVELSFNGMAEKLTLARATVIRSLNSLEKQGLVKRITKRNKDGSKLSNEYEVFCPKKTA